MANKDSAVLKIPPYVREHLEELLPVLERISLDVDIYRGKQMPLPEAIVEQLNTTIADDFQNLGHYPGVSREIKEEFDKLHDDFATLSDPFEYQQVITSLKEATRVLNFILEAE